MTINDNLDDYKLASPDDNKKDCFWCKGTGKTGHSSCCGADFDDDMMICFECKDHCDNEECPECDGTGIEQ